MKPGGSVRFHFRNGPPCWFRIGSPVERQNDADEGQQQPDGNEIAGNAGHHFQAEEPLPWHADVEEALRAHGVADDLPLSGNRLDQGLIKLPPGVADETALLEGVVIRLIVVGGEGLHTIEHTCLILATTAPSSCACCYSAVSPV